MSEIGWETEQFERHRRHLEAVAYRMLGSVSEAEDAVQEAWLRVSRSRQDTIHNARAWLTTIVGRVCIDMLRARQSRREDAVGAWVPEPVVEVDERGDPEQETLMAETVGLALLVLLETLTPGERVAYVLHDMFAIPFAEIGEIIDRSPASARQLASRARRRLRGTIPRQDANLGEQREVVDTFLAALRAGDFEALVAVLDPGVVFRASGARELQQELTGEADVARKFAAFGPRFAMGCQPATVNGHPGLVLETPQGPAGAIGFTVSGGLITAIDVTLDPSRLEALQDSERGGRGSVAERIITEALSWPGVDIAKGHFGSVALCIGRHELGHLHADAAADVPRAPRPLGQRHGGDAEHRRDSEWVTVPLGTEDGVQQTLALLRANYEHWQAG